MTSRKSLKEKKPLTNDELSEAFEERIKRIIKKPWITFLRIDSETEVITIAQHFLNNQNATSQEFINKAFGLDLKQYIGCYVEVGGAKSPVAPIIPGPVKPLLAFKATRSKKNVIVERIELPGFFSEDRKHVWVKSGVWEKRLGDEDHYEKFLRKSMTNRSDELRKKRERTAAKKKEMGQQ